MILLKCGFLKSSFMYYDLCELNPHHFLVGATQQTHQKVMIEMFNSKEVHS